jgi:transcription initiation factor TFIIB
MKGSFIDCPFCRSSDLRANRANETIQCEGCDRILEERCNDFRVLGVNLERDSPYCVVTQDKALARFKFPQGLEGDPFHATGLITVFSHMSIQQQGAFTLTSRTFPGDFAELERLLHDLEIDVSAEATAAEGKGKSSRGGRLLRRVLAAYMVLLDTAEVVNLPRDQVDDALRKFKQHMDSGATVSRLDVPAVALAALAVVQQRDERKTREPYVTIPALAAWGGIDIAVLEKHLKTLQALPDTSPPAAAAQAPMSLLPEFCRMLGMQRSAEQLAVTIGENAIARAVCTRRNPTSIAAAAIYLACNLEDQKKTQTEICKVTGLTEVTLRKVYKELLSQHEKLIPTNYIPKCVVVSCCLHPIVQNPIGSNFVFLHFRHLLIRAFTHYWQGPFTDFNSVKQRCNASNSGGWGTVWSCEAETGVFDLGWP